MIQTAAPKLAADLSLVAGKAKGAAPNGAEIGSFSTILDQSGTAGSPAQGPAFIAEGTPAGAFRTLVDGKPGKADGKKLPEAAAASGDDFAADTASDLPSDQTAIDPASLALMLSGLVPFAPAPQAPSDAALSQLNSGGSEPQAAQPIASLQMTASRSVSAPVLSGAAQTAAVQAGLAAGNAAPATAGLAVPGTPAITLGAIELVPANENPDPIKPATDATIAAQLASRPQIDARRGDAATSGVDKSASTDTVASPLKPVAQPAGDTAAIPATASARPQAETRTAAETPAAAKPDAQAAASTAAIPATVSVRPQAETRTAAEMPAAVKPDAQPAASTVQTHIAADQAQPNAPGARTRTAGRREATSASADQGAALRAAAKPETTLISARADLQAPTATASFHIAANAAAAQSPDMTGAGATSVSSAKPEGPQDFATLVSRLAEAREAASPQLVRTAIAHPDFGQISLQFRHEHNAMSVTMANSDPAFANAVHSAANASFGSDTNHKDNAQQQAQSSSQQHQQSASGAGASAGNGAGQQQQARADQAGQSTSRGQGSAPRLDEQDASAQGQNRGNAGGGNGVYA